MRGAIVNRAALRAIAQWMVCAITLHALVGVARADDAAKEADEQNEATELQPILVEEKSPGDGALPERSFETAEDNVGFGETILTLPAWQGFASAAELLGQSVGAQIRRQGGREDFATLSVRGAPAGQVRILLDGVALGRADNAVVNMADLPLDSVERIELYRGFAPVGLTPISSASVVNLVTRQPTRAEFGVASGLGSFGSGKISAHAAAPVGTAASAAAFATFRTTDGDFEYFYNEGTDYNPNDGEVRKRANNQSDAVDVLLRYQRPLVEGLNLQLRDQGFYKDEGVPGLARKFPPHATLETVRNTSVVLVEDDDKRWAVESNLTYERKDLSGFGFQDNRGRTLASATQGRWSRQLGKSNFVSGSAEVAYETFRQTFTESVSVPDSSSDRWSLAMAGGDEWTLARWNLTASLQLRHQELWNGFDGTVADGSSNTTDRSTDPRVGLRWQPLAGLALKGNIATYYRPPTFDELFGTDGFTEGNPDLSPETGINRDIGWEWTASVPRFRRIEVGYAYFHNNIDDVILVIPNFQRVAKAINTAKARVRGHEARLELEGPHGFSLSANYTYQDAENRSPREYELGKQLASLAPHEAHTRLSWTQGRLFVAYDADLIGEHYIDTPNDKPPIPTRVTHSVALGFGPFAGGFRVMLEADNLGDDLTPDQIGFPLPGRAFFATLSWSSEGASDDRGTENHD
ncbi:MAG: TonB-dependent receptor [Deltaproteobacteria bacterium]|nr:TonB-dependent receptor [Deltaproteobacteria bacterium]